MEFLNAIVRKASPNNMTDVSACFNALASYYDNETKLKAFLFIASIAFMNVSDMHGKERVELIPYFEKFVLYPNSKKTSGCVSVFLFRSRGNREGNDRFKVQESYVSEMLL